MQQTLSPGTEILACLLTFLACSISPTSIPVESEWSFDADSASGSVSHKQSTSISIELRRACANSSAAVAGDATLRLKATTNNVHVHALPYNTTKQINWTGKECENGSLVFRLENILELSASRDAEPGQLITVLIRGEIEDSRKMLFNDTLSFKTLHAGAFYPEALRLVKLFRGEQRQIRIEFASDVNDNAELHFVLQGAPPPGIKIEPKEQLLEVPNGQVPRINFLVHVDKDAEPGPGQAHFLAKTIFADDEVAVNEEQFSLELEITRLGRFRPDEIPHLEPAVTFAVILIISVVQECICRRKKN